MKQMKMQQSIKDDEFETPKELYDGLCKMYRLNPILDASANSQNSKCEFYLNHALFQEWSREGGDVWCNPPHTLNSEFIARAEEQHLKYGIRIMMILPANFGGTRAFHKYIQHKRFYEFIQGRPTFLKGGKKTQFNSRNAYIVIIWGIPISYIY